MYKLAMGWKLPRQANWYENERYKKERGEKEERLKERKIKADGGKQTWIEETALSASSFKSYQMQ